MHVHNNVSTSISRSGQEALFFECDLLNRESIDQLCSTIASKVPSGIDILVNNAGKLTVSIFLFNAASLLFKHHTVYKHTLEYYQR